MWASRGVDEKLLRRCSHYTGLSVFVLLLHNKFHLAANALPGNRQGSFHVRESLHLLKWTQIYFLAPVFDLNLSQSCRTLRSYPAGGRSISLSP